MKMPTIANKHPAIKKDILETTTTVAGVALLVETGKLVR